MKKTSSESQLEWDEYFMEMAELVSSKSKDRSTKVGCVIVGPNREVRTTGYNGFCRGVNDDVEERHYRPEKLYWVEHAERNAIYNAARNAIPLEGCTMYSTFFPCTDCARALIQSGIKAIKTKDPKNFARSEDWMESFNRSKIMFDEVGIEIVYVKE